MTQAPIFAVKDTRFNPSLMDVSITTLNTLKLMEIVLQ